MAGDGRWRAGSVTGADFTLPMLAVARRRAAAGARRSRFVQADALALPFAAASFDVVTISYGLRNIADIPRALGEMRRVLAPGGRAVVLDFGKPDNATAGASETSRRGSNGCGIRYSVPNVSCWSP